MEIVEKKYISIREAASIKERCQETIRIWAENGHINSRLKNNELVIINDDRFWRYKPPIDKNKVTRLTKAMRSLIVAYKNYCIEENKILQSKIYKQESIIDVLEQKNKLQEEELNNIKKQNNLLELKINYYREKYGKESNFE